LPIRISTETLPFKDEDDKPISDASFTIRKRLSHNGQMDYMEALAEVSIDPESGEVKTEASRIHLKQISDILLSDSLLSWVGVLDSAEQPLPTQRYGEADEFYLSQITKAIQERNRPAAKASGPKDAAPSASS
jgi:hypothetical protein